MPSSLLFWPQFLFKILISNCPMPIVRHTPSEHSPQCLTRKHCLRATCFLIAPRYYMTVLNMNLVNEICFCDPKFLVIRAGGSPTCFYVCITSLSHGLFVVALLLEGKVVGELSQCQDEIFSVTNVFCRPSWSLKSTCFVDKLC